MKNSKIILVINKLEREKRSMEMIKNKLIYLNNNVEVKIIHSLDKQFFPTLITFKPDIVVTFPFTAVMTSTRYYILKYLLNFHLVVLRTEGLILICDEFHLNLMTGKEQYGNNIVDYEIFWGAESAKIIGNILLQQNKLSHKNRIKYFGAPSFENFNVPDTLPDDIQSKLRLFEKEKTLLIATGFHYAEYSEADIINAGDLVEKNSQNFINEYVNWLSFLDKCKLFRYMWINIIDLCAKQNPDMAFVIKNHPLEINVIKVKNRPDPYACLKKHNNVILINRPLPVKDIIQKCGVLFHYGSTTMLEAYLNGVPSVYVESKDIRKVDGSINPFGVMDIPSTISIDILQLPDFINSLMNRPVHFEESEKIDTFLERQVCFSKNVPYRPTESIATFLLSINQQPQKILHTDQYLLHALEMFGYDSLIQYLLKMSYACILSSEYNKALYEFLYYLEMILLIKQKIVQNYYYYVSICFFYSNKLDKSLEAIKLELQYFPYNDEAKQYYSILQNNIEPT